MIIDNQAALDQVCLELTRSRIIAVDTEFFRKVTYYAKLSIIQVQTNELMFIIDALNGLNLSSFKEILLNEKIVKLFHAPREDLEIFYHLFGKLPKNIFDTQIAAHVCGFGRQLSYHDVSAKILNINVNKNHQKSNWLKRPLSQNMIDYAMSDVKYLEPIYCILQGIIAKNNLEELYDQQITKLLSIDNYVVKPENAWQKIRFNNRSKNFVLRVQTLAAFREETAKQIDVPRQHFITDKDLLKICDHLPLNHKQLVNLRLQSKYLITQKYIEQVINLCNGLNSGRVYSKLS